MQTSALSPSDPLTQLPGVGPKRAERLAALGLETIEDLLRFAPRSYEDRGEIVPAAEVRQHSFATVRGVLLKRWSRRGRGGKPILTAQIEDDSGRCQAMWFHSGFMAKNFEVGAHYVLAGKVSKNGMLVQPESVRLESAEAPSPERMTGVRPLYSLTEGVSQRLLFDLLQAVMPYVENLHDPWSEAVRAEAETIELGRAVQQAHRPATIEEAREGKERLLLDVLIPIELEMRKRLAARNERQAPRAHASGGGAGECIRGLPFTLSTTQAYAIDEVLEDFDGERPMSRMLVGDVGTGKTAVALAALAEARSRDWQGAFLAPTELLARQHFRQARELLPGGDDGVVLLTGSRTEAAATEARQRLASGDARIAIGTHALFSDATRFQRLGLVVIDEQHRFGVAQRQKLLEKSESPHCLFLTATPIPRSLALLAFGDSDLSLLEPRPGARGDVMTRIPPASKRREALRFVRERIEAGEQAFFVRPRIDADEGGALALHEELERGALRGVSVGLVHGRQAAEERDEILERFRAGELRALVATTIVEVGLDVPGATILWVEEAERFGLSQLHQLRGRIARRGQKGYCLLWEGDEPPEASHERLSALVEIDDGLQLAEIDLATRGPGELLGQRQSGRFGLFSSLGAAGSGSDLAGLARRARRAAERIEQEAP